MPDLPITSIVAGTKSITINSSANPITVQAAVPGKRFVVLYLLMKSAGTTTLGLNSGGTEISGGNLVASESLEMGGHGVPVLVGVGVNEAFTIDNSGTVLLEGTALVGLVDTVVT